MLRDSCDHFRYMKITIVEQVRQPNGCIVFSYQERRYGTAPRPRLSSQPRHKNRYLRFRKALLESRETPPSDAFIQHNCHASRDVFPYWIRAPRFPFPVPSDPIQLICVDAIVSPARCISDPIRVDDRYVGWRGQLQLDQILRLEIGWPFIVAHARQSTCFVRKEVHSSEARDRVRVSHRTHPLYEKLIEYSDVVLMFDHACLHERNKAVARLLVIQIRRYEHSSADCPCDRRMIEIQEGKNGSANPRILNEHSYSELNRSRLGASVVVG